MCIKELDNFIKGLPSEAKGDEKAITKEFNKFCKKAKSKKERLVSSALSQYCQFFKVKNNIQLFTLKIILWFVDLPPPPRLFFYISVYNEVSTSNQAETCFKLTHK